MSALDGYTLPRAIVAEGARIGIVTCLTCGAAVMLDATTVPADIDTRALHRAWHDDGAGARVPVAVPPVSDAEARARELEAQELPAVADGLRAREAGKTL